MAKYGSTQVSLWLVSGYNLAAQLTESITRTKESVTQQTNPFGVESEQHTPVGIDRCTINMGGGFFDPLADALHTAIGQVIGVVRICALGVMGNVIGKAFTGFQANYSQKYEVVDTNGQLTKANVSYILSATDYNREAGEEGVIVQHLATFTADWDTKTGGANAPDAPVDYTTQPQRDMPINTSSVANPSVITMQTEHGSPIVHGLTTGDKILITGHVGSTPDINGERTITVVSPTQFSIPLNVTVGGSGGSFVKVNSLNGGAGYLEVTDYSGFTGFVGKINDSPDDITYSALVTFADLAAVHSPASQRVTASRTVDRYLAFNGDVTGAGSITVFAGFCRYQS